jgi:2-iminobutanoate/2-iminopropanoate deaminase
MGAAAGRDQSKSGLDCQAGLTKFPHKYSRQNDLRDFRELFTDSSGHREASMAGRAAWEVIDGSGLYFSRLVSAGSYAFVGGTAVDDAGRLAPEAAVRPPYHLSPPAHVVQQAEYLFDRYAEGLAQVGSSLDELVQVEQFTPRKLYADGYVDTRSRRIERRRPTTALAASGRLTPRGAVINSTGIAVIPGRGVAKEVHAAAAQEEALEADWAALGDTFATEPAFTEVISAGPYVFVTGDAALDWIAGDIEKSVKVPDWIWLGSEVRNEAEFLLTRLEAYLARVDATLAHVVHMTVFLTDIADIFELDRVWRRRFGDDPPARTIIPVRGLGVPRFEGGPLGHRELGVRMEHLTRAIRPGLGAAKEVVHGGVDPLAHEAPAVKAGPLLWISQQYAGLPDGRARGGARDQLELIFEQLEELCRAAGTELANLVRLRAFVTDDRDAYELYAVLREWVPADPPTVVVSTVPAPLPVPGAVVMVDAVAFVPGA